MPDCAKAPGRRTLSVVVPIYNEQEVLPEFHKRLSQALDGLGMPAEIIFVNDGSRDGTLALLREIRGRDPRVGVVNFSRNFGKEAALTAGLNYASGDGVVVIDVDLQDPPELIPDFVQIWRQEGADIVFGQRSHREGETWLKKTTASLFYRVMRHVGQVRIPRDTGDFRLLDRRAVDALKQFPEQHRFMKGLFTWIGFDQRPVLYRRDARYAGETKWNYWRLWNFALEGITSYTVVPLQVASYLGFGVAIIAFVYLIVLIAKTLVWGDPVAGYPSLMAVILFLGGVQLVFIGIIGEYLGRIFNETKRRPLYILESFTKPTVQKINGE